MKVYKFGGASIKDAEGIRNLDRIVSAGSDKLIVVVSAFGKTTNALENVLNVWIKGDQFFRTLLDDIYKYHQSVIDNLFSDTAIVSGKLDISFAVLKEKLFSEHIPHYDFIYDQVVSFGEIWSTTIVAEYLKSQHQGVEWTDIRNCLLTDDRYRDANILWNESTIRVRDTFNFKMAKVYVTQGFIGGTVAGDSTTLGREGSDYTAAVLANMLDAESVFVWKDVPGILNADPKWLPDAVKIDEISYKEAVEMTFSGAKVIHPKTIKPLHNKNIPLHVRSFLEPEKEGTVIKAVTTAKNMMPVFIRKRKSDTYFHSSKGLLICDG